MSTETPLILVVDDDPLTLVLLKRILELDGFQVLTANHGEEALKIFQEKSPDMVLLDIAMPDIDGYTVCRRIREFSEVPIIIVTATGYDNDKKKRFSIRADDWVTKPFSPSEISDRIHTIFRRIKKGEKTHETIFRYKDLQIDFNSRKVEVGSKELKLTPTEYEILSYISLNAGRVCTPDQILNKVWGEESIGTPEILQASITRLRKKLSDNAYNPSYIFTRPGIGYIMPCDIETPIVAIADIDTHKAIMAATAHSLKGEFLHIGSSVKNIQELAGDSKEAQEEVDIIKRSLDYGQLLLRKLLDYLELGKSPKASSVAASELLHKVETLARPRLPSNIQMEVIIADKTKEAMISGDAEQLTLVLIELVNNAINALRVLGGIIQIRLTTCDSKVAVSVKDNGPGIPDDVQQNLFKKQISSKRGLGLGLFLCNKIIKALGGKLTLESSLGQGTTVTIILPISGDKEES